MQIFVDKPASVKIKLRKTWMEIDNVIMCVYIDINIISVNEMAL